MSTQTIPSFNSASPAAQLQQAYTRDGFLKIENLYSRDECAALQSRMSELIENYDPAAQKTVFSTTDQKHADDEYFRTSGDKIRFFLEKDALDDAGNLTCAKHLAINKVGHALHDLDEVFDKFSRKPELAKLAATIGLVNPLLLQSMYIFKQAHHGGEVGAHQDSTFIYTEPQSCVGFWIALEDATVANGCLWATPGAHNEPLRDRYRYIDGKLQMEQLDTTPLAAGTAPLEASAGTVIVLHGRLPHNSGANSSDRSRQAYALHCISGASRYDADNWLQRDAAMPLRGFNG